ncbi:cytochrome b/b6 domain-containing protein [Mucilaginibacter ximonensis]|uniref:Cytochrome b/b6 domain-containing protein n=1 Tax=Mucilaginibacter ximonensis TaxID=538021 RepID=A0ABW5YCK0_9SPHI
MTVIDPTRKNIEHPDQIKKNSAGLRFWHWASALTISGSLLTVLINATLNDRSVVAPVVQAEFAKSNVTVTARQAGSIGHALEDKVWEIHTYIGYVLAGLFLFRLVLEAFQLADQKFLRRLRSAYHQFEVTKKNRELARHELVVKSLYAMFYVLLGVMVITGLFLAFEDLLAPFKAIRHSVKEVHSFCMYLVLAFIAVHLAGVFLAERKDSPGIISDMINGGRP